MARGPLFLWKEGEAAGLCEGLLLRKMGGAADTKLILGDYKERIKRGKMMPISNYLWTCIS